MEMASCCCCYCCKCIERINGQAQAVCLSKGDSIVIKCQTEKNTYFKRCFPNENNISQSAEREKKKKRQFIVSSFLSSAQVTTLKSRDIIQGIIQLSSKKDEINFTGGKLAPSEHDIYRPVTWCWRTTSANQAFSIECRNKVILLQFLWTQKSVCIHQTIYAWLWSQFE